LTPITEKPIFHDASGRRGRRLGWLRRLLVIALIVLGVLFALSLFSLVPGSPLPLHPVREALKNLNLLSHNVSDRHRHETLLAANTTVGKTLRELPPRAAPPLAIAFYTPWDEPSIDALRQHIGQLDWVVPHWLSIYGPAHSWHEDPDVKGRAIIDAAATHPQIYPMIQNAENGVWDGAGLGALMHDPVQRLALIDKLDTYLAANHASGVVFDFEEVPPEAQLGYRQFLIDMRARLAPENRLVTIAAPADDPDWDYAVYGRITDRIFLMAYDQHWESGSAGPIAAEPWFASVLAKRLRVLDPAKTIACFGNYAYDWTAKRPEAVDLSVEEAWSQARDNDATIGFDPVSRNPTYSYTSNGQQHVVWLLDAVTAYNQLRIARAMHVAGAALWRLGSEDPSLWKVWGHGAAGSLAAIPSGTSVDIEGQGEIIQIAATPTTGSRTLKLDTQGLIVSAALTAIPTPYVVDRAGFHPGLVALTFDDGPDPVWTPLVLDELKAAKVPATFFVIGSNVVAHPDLVRRILAEGHEVGNHTYTHPNLAVRSKVDVRIELAATERAVQAFTGHGMRLFRAPFFGDAEPQSVDELVPILIAQQLGYTSVGLHVDPLDWETPGADAIVDRTVKGVESTDELNGGQIVLLHDSGGDRSGTVAALPRIIARLRADGYRFVPVSALAGLSGAQVNPVVVNEPVADKAMFNTLSIGGKIVGALFTLAITLGILRALLLMIGALLEARQRRQLAVPAIDPARFVSVLIPAYNEARVIEATVARVLASVDTAIEVIVIDDGSKDETGDIVERIFGGDARVRLLRLVNGGKARALNQGLLEARGDVVIALDADTQFESTTIARLARWFADPGVGAVAGNAKVGNRVNLLTRWQALEYITAQNLERRALSLVDAITVVPGAVGAWRMAALQAVGGYPADTLAEDQDLTIAVQRAGWAVVYDPDAVAWTEAPETARGLMQQRYRWAFGTLQCLWKHRVILRSGRPAGLARIGLPQAWLFQIGFGLVSPLIDLGLAISIAQTIAAVWEHGVDASHAELLRMGSFWLVFSAIDLASGFVAFALEPRERKRLLWLLLPQRFGYRQMMYYVVLRAVWSALHGPLVGWGKLDRTASVAARA